MRDRYDAEIWGSAHDQLSEWLDERARRAGGAPRRGAGSVRVPAQLVAAIAAVSFAGLSLGSVFA
jgi:hypothetical protein